MPGKNCCSSKEISDPGYSHCSFSRCCLHHHFPVGISGASLDKADPKQKLQLQTPQELLKLKKSQSKPIPPPHCLDGVKQHGGVKDSQPLFAISWVCPGQGEGVQCPAGMRWPSGAPRLGSPVLQGAASPCLRHNSTCYGTSSLFHHHGSIGATPAQGNVPALGPCHAQSSAPS